MVGNKRSTSEKFMNVQHLRDIYAFVKCSWWTLFVTSLGIPNNKEMLSEKLCF